MSLWMIWGDSWEDIVINTGIYFINIDKQWQYKNYFNIIIFLTSPYITKSSSWLNKLKKNHNIFMVDLSGWHHL